ncbi:hypothetical protein EG835_06025, partial [bacterium]|nr:hypothetical protein [bacterium]
MDGGGTTWARSTATKRTGLASATHAYSAAGMQNGWLVSPAVAVPAGGASFTFYEYTSFTSFYFKHSLWACTTGCGAPPTNFTEIAAFPAPTSAWRLQTVSLNAYSGGNVTLAFRYEGNDADSWFIDDVLVPSAPPAPVVVDAPALICNPVGGSLVAGFVTDANTTNGITGAKVVRDLGGLATTMTATGNLPAGFYYMFSPTPVITGPSTRTFTATKDGYGPIAQAVNLIPDTVNRLDFALPAASLSLGGWPFVIDGRLTPDGLPAWDKTDDFSVLNSGGLPAELSLNVTALTTTWLRKYPAFVPAAPSGPQRNSIGRAEKAPVLSNAKRYPGLAGSLAGVPAYGVDVYPGGNFVSWADASVPGTWSVVAPAATYFAGDFINGDFSTMYALNYDTSAFTSINTATGAATVIGPATPNAGESWSGLAGAPGGILYGSATTCSAST